MPLSPKQLTDGLQTLQAIAFDVDGVLTDGTLTWAPSGEESKRFSFADIMGISLLRRLGIRMALISGEPSPLVDRYAEKMHIPSRPEGHPRRIRLPPYAASSPATFNIPAGAHLLLRR